MAGKKTSNDYYLVVAIGIFLLGIISIFIPYSMINGIGIGGYALQIDKYNDLGAFIGGITTPFFSMAAFLLLFLTYTSQKKELEESKDLLKNQNDSINKQQFENTFFSMINLHNQIVSQMDASRRPIGPKSFHVESNPIIIKGRECFDEYFKYFESEFSDKAQHELFLGKPNKETLIILAYEDFFEKKESALGHYFRNLYHVVKFVNSSKISNKKDYTNILRAQLSTLELFFIYLNCASKFGDEKFKPLVEDYSLLKNISKNDKLEKYDLRALYKTKAFV